MDREGSGFSVKRSYEIDMVHGPLLGKMLIFAVPLMLSGVLQLLFNAADIEEALHRPLSV